MTPEGDPGAVGVAWKAFASFGKRTDGFHPCYYAEVLRRIGIETAEFTLPEDREVLLELVDRLFTSRPAFDRFVLFAAVLRLGRSCYTPEDRAPFAELARSSGLEGLADALSTEAVFDSKRNAACVRDFDEVAAPLFAAEREGAVQLGLVAEMRAAAKAAKYRAWGGAS